MNREGNRRRPTASRRSGLSPTHTRESEFPDDLILIKVKFESECRACGVELRQGTRAHWSPSTKSAVWCQECVRAPSDGGTGTDTPQDRWARLCRYLSRSILAEMADTLAGFQDSEKWFPHDAESDVLITGERDEAPVPRRLIGRLGESGRQPEFIHGWPTLVAMNRSRRPMIAPLFAVSVRAERRGDEWVGCAVSEPEFNLSIIAGELFDPSVKEEIDAVVGEGLPFGDAPELARVARKIAHVLGIDIVSDLDPHSLDRRCEADPGLYNSAVWVRADGSRNAHQSLLEELEMLARRRDWTKTAASCLIPDRPGAEEPAHRPSMEPLAAPLPCNDSQELTLERFRREPLTVVTGPPGTGKSQLVVNAVANVWMDGERGLVSSTNNGAVDVVVERANEICSGMLLRTGRRQEREALADRAAEAVATAGRHATPSEGLESVASEAKARAELAAAAERRDRLSADLIRAAELNRKLAETVEALEKHARAVWKRNRAPDLALDSETIERKVRRTRRAWFFRRRRTRRLLETVGCKDSNVSLDLLAHWAAFDQERIAFMNELSRTDERIGDPGASLRQAGEEWSATSRTAVIRNVRAGVRKGRSTLDALSRVNPGARAFKTTIRRCLAHARGWACTALSMQRSFPLEPDVFDLVIIDEASQCSLAVALPLAYRASRLAVIGDPHQLAPINTLSDGRLRKIAMDEGLDNHDLVRRGIHPGEGSAYHAFEYAIGRNSEQPIVLDEHYRSHPYIARWFNREFYEGALTVLTDTAGMASGERSIAWIDVPGEARKGDSGSWTNAEEAEAAIRQLVRLVQSACGSVGVVTPFAAQASLIRRLAHRHPRLGSEILSEVDFECGTAHRFQGAERDAIIFSAVLAPGITKRTVSWVERERNLINVAVSRARKSLIVLGHSDVGGAGSRTLASLRSYLAETSTHDETVRPATAKFRTDSRSEARLLEAMRGAGFHPSAKLFVHGYELDFALLQPRVRLNVEVDGGHHTDARGKLRRQDVVRDRILAGHGWEVIRIPAWRCVWEVGAAIRDIQRRLDTAGGRGAP